jgi:hypothetical protein
MAIQTVQLNSLMGDSFTVWYRYDDGGLTPPGSFIGLIWSNFTPYLGAIIPHWFPGRLLASLSAGVVTALVTAAGVILPLKTGWVVHAVDHTDTILQAFTVSADVALSALTIPVQSVTTSVVIPADTSLRVTLPPIWIPASTDSVQEDPVYGSVTKTAFDSLNMSAWGIPMLSGSPNQVPPGIFRVRR